MTKILRLTTFLGLQKSTVGMLLMVILVGMGERMAERFLPIYLIALGGGPIVIGLLNGLDNLLSALYAFPGGYLSDRLGFKKALLVFNLFAMLGYLLVILIPAWPAVLVGAIFFLSWSAISLPATISLVVNTAHWQTYHGRFHAFSGSANPHGAEPDHRWISYRIMGRT